MANELQYIFENAVELNGDAREAYLRDACGTNETLRVEVDNLLKSHECAAGFLASPTAHASAAVDDLATVAQSSCAPFVATTADSALGAPGTRIGPYKILQLIGEGGFGSVFMAEQEKPVARRVALKIIKLGMDTRQVVARFEQERQALAIMDHPNIARVFDAGATETGRPFFVMELVKGEPIVAYCDRNNLSIPERLELFAQVCTAVQHAHTKGIIHRDIKPSNILVAPHDGQAHVKVIDFGIAKATAGKLTEMTLFTEHRQLIGTPEHMSPEQADGELDIDTRTDVYSLGVVLYELLTGTTPFTSKDLRSAAYAEIQRIIREVEPPKPSTRLSRNSETIASVAVQRRCEPRKLGILVRGELDWIVMKALEKDRRRRYESASGLGLDIQRFLAKEPVSAGPPGARYKLQKFVQRHRARVAAAALVCAALVLGIVGTSVGMVRAIDEKRRADAAMVRALESSAAETKAREEAQRRLSQVEKASGILSSIFQSLNPREIAASGRPLQAVLVDNLGKALTELEGEAIGDSQAVLNLQVRLAQSLLAMGESQRAIVVLEKAHKTSANTFGPEDPFTLGCASSLAMAYGGAGKFDLAIPMLERLVAQQTAQAKSDDAGTALTMHNLGLLYRETGRAAEALPLFEKAAAARKAALGLDHPYTLSTLNALATTQLDLGNLELALPLFKETVAAHQRTLGADHPSTLAAMNNMGTAYAQLGDTARAVQLLEGVVALARGKFGNNSPNTMAFMTSLGHAYVGDKQFEKAVIILEESLSLMRARHGNDFPNTIATMTNLASAYWSLRQLEKSIPLYEEAVGLYDRNFGRKRSETQRAVANLGINYRDAGRFAEALPLLKEAYKASRQNRRLSFVNYALAETYVSLGRLKQAVPVIEAAVDDVRDRQPAGSPELASGIMRCGALLLKVGDAPGAERLIREALAIRDDVQPDAWTTFHTRSLLGEALLVQKHYADAERLLVDGFEGLKKRQSQMQASDRVCISDAAERLVSLYTATDQPDKAQRWQDERKQYPSAQTPPTQSAPSQPAPAKQN